MMEVNVTVTPKLTSTHGPPIPSRLSLSIDRVPILDEAAGALMTSKKFNFKVKLSSPVKCFVCGGTTVSVTTTLGRYTYLRQVKCFKTYLSGTETYRSGVETCASCLQEIQHVWQLNQKIDGIKEDIARIVERLTTAKPNNGDDAAVQNAAEAKVRKGTWGPKSRRRDKTVKDSSAQQSKLNQSGAGLDPDNDPKDYDVKINPEQDADNESPSKRQKMETTTPNIMTHIATDHLKSGTCPCFACGQSYTKLPDLPTNSPTRVVDPKLERISLLPPDKTISTLLSKPGRTLAKPRKRYKPKAKSENESKENTSQKTFPCSSCSKKLTSQRKWVIHEALVCKVDGWTPEKLSKFAVTLLPCPIEGCGRVLGYQNQLKTHLASHTGSRRCSCSKCGKLFKHPSTLSKHVCGLPLRRKNPNPAPKTVPSKPERVLCDLCGASVRPYRFSLHKKMVHEKVRNHACPHCEKSFFCSRQRNRHVTTVHEGKKDNGQNGLPYICQDCGAQYRYISGLKSHQARIHGDKGKTHQCSKCPKKYYTRHELVSHENRHEKYGWCCGACGRNFESQPELEKHQEKWAGKLCPAVQRKMPKKKQETTKIVDTEKQIASLTNKIKKAVQKIPKEKPKKTKKVKIVDTRKQISLTNKFKKAVKNVAGAKKSGNVGKL